MQITKKEWIEQVEDQLFFMPSLSRVTLICDGYRLTLKLFRVKKTLSFRIFTYINGSFNHEMMSEKNVQYADIQNRFLRKTKLNSSNIKMTKKNIRAFGKKRIEEHNNKYTAYLYDPSWLNFSSLYNHLIKNNKSVELTCPKCEKVHTGTECESVSNDQSIN